MEQLVLQVVGGIVAIVALTIGFYARKFYLKKLENEDVAYWTAKAQEVYEYLISYEALADIAVRYVENVWTGKLYGPEKLQKAKDALVKLAEDMGLEITIEDIDVLLEAALTRMKEGWAKAGE